MKINVQEDKLRKINFFLFSLLFCILRSVAHIRDYPSLGVFVHGFVKRKTINLIESGFNQDNNALK